MRGGRGSALNLVVVDVVIFIVLGGYSLPLPRAAHPGCFAASLLRGVARRSRVALIVTNAYWRRASPAK